MLEEQNVSTSTDSEACAHKDSEGIIGGRAGTLARTHTRTHAAASYLHPENMNEAEFKSDGLIGLTGNFKSTVFGL